MLTPKGIEKLLKKISETGGLTQDMEELVKKLKDDFDEREGMLNRYRENYDGEDDDYDYKFYDIENMISELEKVKSERDDYKKRYIERFFGNSQIVDEEKEEQEEKKSEDITFDDILKDMEKE